MSRRSGPLWTFVILAGLTQFSYFLARSPSLPLYATSVGVNLGWVGLVVAASSLSLVLLRAPASRLAERLGPRRTLVLAGLVFTGAPFLYLVAESGPALVAVRALHGAALALYLPVALSVTRAFPGHPASKWGARLSLLGGAGLVAAPFAGGILLTAAGFKQVYLVSAAAGGLVLLLALRMSDSWAHGEREPLSVSLPGPLASVRELARNGPAFMTGLMESSLYFGLGITEAYLPLYADSRGLTYWQNGVVYGAHLLVMLGVRPILGVLSDRFGRRPMILSGVILTGGAVGSFAFEESFEALVILSVVLGFGIALILPATTALRLDLMTLRGHKVQESSFHLLNDVSHALGPALAGLLLGVLAMSYFDAFGIAAAIIVIVASTFYLTITDPSPYNEPLNVPSTAIEKPE